MITMRYINPAADRARLAQWGAIVGCQKFGEILRRVGGVADLNQLEPRRFKSVSESLRSAVALMNAARATESHVTKVHEEVVQEINASHAVADALRIQREREESERANAATARDRKRQEAQERESNKRLAPFRSALANAEAKRRQLETLREAAEGAVCTARDLSNAGRANHLFRSNPAEMKRLNDLDSAACRQLDEIKGDIDQAYHAYSIAYDALEKATQEEDERRRVSDE